MLTSNREDLYSDILQWCRSEKLPLRQRSSFQSTTDVESAPNTTAPHPAATPLDAATLLGFPTTIPAFDDASWRSLVNLGSTCYGNALLAVLSKVHSFRAWTHSHSTLVAANHAGVDCPLCLLDHDLKLLAGTRSQSRRTFQPITMAFRSKWCPAFNNTTQQDAFEALNQLLGRCDERDTQRLNELLADVDAAVDRDCLLQTTPFFHVFGGRQQSRLQCRACKQSSITNETFANLSIALPNASGGCVKQLIAAHHKSEHIEGACTFPGCTAQERRRKAFTVSRWPQVLVVHLKRWSFRTTTRTFDKLNQNIKLDLEFHPHASAHYRLRGVVEHHGNAYAGHYTAFARGPREAQWHHYNDAAKPRAVESNDVLAATAYILIYEQ